MEQNGTHMTCFYDNVLVYYLVLYYYYVILFSVIQCFF